MAAKDIHGDTPIHSAVKTGNTRQLEVLVKLAEDHLPIPLKTILETSNKEGRTPLQVASDQRKYNIVELLFGICAEKGYCQDVTGVTPRSDSASIVRSAKLLPEALAKGNCKVLDIFVRVLYGLNYSKKSILHILNLPDREGLTAWVHLMDSHDTCVLKEACEILQSHGLHLDKLHVDTYDSTMLHLAYRADCKEKITILEDCGSSPNCKNRRGFRACERTHKLKTSSTTQQAEDQGSSASVIDTHQTHSSDSMDNETGTPMNVQLQAASTETSNALSMCTVEDTPVPLNNSIETSILEVSDCVYKIIE